MDGAAREKAAAVQHRTCMPDVRQLAGEIVQLLLFGSPVPGKPTGFIVLAVGVVVAMLGAAVFIAAAQHGHALAEQQRSQEVAFLAGAQLVCGFVWGFAFRAEVPAFVLVMAVAAVFAIGLVVFFLVGHQVVQRVAVVGGDEVDAGAGQPPVGFVEVAAAGEPVGHFGNLPFIALPEFAHAIAVLAVPLGPLHRKVAHLVAAFANVPRFGNQFHLRDYRILVDGVEKCGQFAHFVQAARQGRGQVKAKTIHVHLRDPVAQAVHDQPQRARVEHIDGISRAGVIHVECRVVSHEAVVGLVVNALHGQHRAEMVAFGGVVVHHIQNHFNAVAVQFPDHILKFGDLPARLARRTVFGVGRKKPDGIVAPVIAQSFVEQVAVMHELVYRHQFDSGYAQVFQVAYGFGRAQGGIRAPDGGVNAGMQFGETLDVHFVDQRLVHRDIGRRIALPVKLVVHHHRFQGVGGIVLVVRQRVTVFGLAADVVAEHGRHPAYLAANGFGIRIEQHLARIEEPPAGRIESAVHTVAVQLSGVDIGQVNMPNVVGLFADADAGGFQARILRIEQAEFNGFGVLAEEGKIHALPVVCGSQRIRLALPTDRLGCELDVILGGDRHVCNGHGR